MGLPTILLSVALALVISKCEVESGRCPPPRKVPGYKQTCYGDYDCKNGQICCPNQSHTKSCTYPAPYGGKYKRHMKPLGMLIKLDIIPERVEELDYEDVNAAGVYCDGVKCLPWEDCLPDPYTGKLKCQVPYSVENQL